MGRWFWPGLATAGVVLFFALFLGLPLVEVLRGGLLDEHGRLTLTWLAEVFRNPLYREGLVNTALLAVVATGFTLLLALPLAWLGDRFDFPGKKLFSAALLAPLVLPPFVGALGIQKILGPTGALNLLLCHLGVITPATAPDWLGGGGFWAVAAVEALHLYPILYLNVAAALANVDPALREAAANLGCTGFRQFRRITLPLILPGVFAGGTLVFIWSLTELGTPLMFGYNRVTPVQIFNGILEIGDNPFPFALVIVLLAVTALLYLLARWTVGRHGYATSGKAGGAAAPERLRGGRAWLAGGAFAAVALAGVLPHLAVIGLAFSNQWYNRVFPAGWTLEHARAALGHDLVVPSIVNSVHYAGGALLLAMAAGVLVAWLTERVHLPGAGLLDSLAMLPLAVPGLVLAFGYLAMTRPGRWLDVLDPIANPTVLLIIAYAVRRLPYVVRAAAAGLRQCSITLEEAAACLGARPGTVFRRITLPLIAANLIAGGVLAFSFAMLEVSDSLLLAQRAVYFPITKAIYELSMLLGEGPAIAAALGVWTMLFLGATLLLATALLGKRLGALFRA